MRSLFDAFAETVQPITLRPYQVDCVEAIGQARAEGTRRMLAVLFTGAGKTTIFADLARREAEHRGSTLVLAHREEMIDQAVDRLRTQAGIDAYAETGSERAPRGVRTVVASVASLGRKGSDRLGWMRPTLVVCDEAHHAAADTYMEAFRRFGCFDRVGPDLLGVTATPHRMDNRPLHGSEKAIFERVVYSYDVVGGIRDGWLSDVRAYRMQAGYSLAGVKTTAGDFNGSQLAELIDTDGHNLEAFKAWREVADGRRTIVFCASVGHSRRMADLFRSYGIAAESVDGSLAKDVRKGIIERVRSGETQVLTNCNVATEGFDCPELECVLLLRPTMSWPLYAQMIGRGLRLAPGKEDCVVIDVVGTSEGKSLANVPDMFGLPSGFSGAGDSIKQTVQTLDGLPDYLKARLAARKFDLNSLPLVLQEIDLLADLSPTEDVKRLSRLAWLRVSDGRYSLSAGRSRDGEETHRRASLWVDTLGVWRVLVSSSRLKPREYYLGAVSDREAFQLADRAVERAWPGIRALLAHDAEWRGRPPTERQANALRRFGYDVAVVATMTMGEASAALDKEFAALQVDVPVAKVGGKRTRRSNGEGQVYRDGDGWRLVVPLGRRDPETGRAQVRKVRFRGTKTEALAELNRLRREVEAGGAS